MNIKMSSGKLIVSGNSLPETLSDIRTSMIYEIIDKIDKHKNDLNDLETWTENEVCHIVSQLPARDLGKYLKILLFNYIKYTFIDFVEELRQEEICKKQEKSIKKRG